MQQSLDHLRTVAGGPQRRHDLAATAQRCPDPRVLPGRPQVSVLPLGAQRWPPGPHRGRLAVSCLPPIGPGARIGKRDRLYLKQGLGLENAKPSAPPRPGPIFSRPVTRHTLSPEALWTRDEGPAGRTRAFGWHLAYCVVIQNGPGDAISGITLGLIANASITRVKDVFPLECSPPFDRRTSRPSRGKP
jgi:hypothetical protein